MKICSVCKHRERRPKGRYCVPCHAEYMRGWRRTHVMSEDQRRKDNCRSYAHVYLKRGKLVRADCVSCGSVESQMHHPDYSKPLQVVWLCRPCRVALHAQEREPNVTRETFPAGFTQRETFFPPGA
jgi:hypothetical protein